MFNNKYLTGAHLKGFDSYKYKAVDTSPLSNYVMHPFWNTAVKFIPKSVAPNLLTFLGFIAVVTVAALTSWYDYNWYNGQCEIPNFVFITGSLLIFLAYNLDGINGKQARRIGVSGPLGEMFDHGLDSYIVFFIPFCLFSIFGRDEFSVPLFRGYLIVASVVLNFYVTHCEKYCTRVLYLPWGYDVAMSYENRTGHCYSFVEAMRPLWSMVSMVAVVTYWAHQSPNDVMENHPRVYLRLFGTLFSNIASRLIVAEMSGQWCELFNWFLWPLTAGVMVSMHHPGVERIVLHVLLLLSVLAHVHYGVCVVRQMCDHFEVECFSVTKAKRK